MELLLVEDNSRISDFVMKGLEESGFSVVLANNGIEARTLISQREWDMILLDIMLPGIDGIELLQYTRYKKINTPIIVISALSDPEDKIKALDYGADDYITKPFLFRELVAHINALTRRTKLSYNSSSDVLECGNLKMDVDRHKIERAGEDINLTLQEFKLLKLLLENKDKVLSRTQLLDTVWGLNYDTNTNIVDVYISYLRNKIDRDDLPKLIKTIKGRGYMIQSNE
ncbi:response regulator transcription factor [Dysgonomonas macrotermitis]|uniref:DNA-binding response regulator, OmpR family, contains REC and winged-helix (WHTH) domain n=1 Tax=Dysgonomonas macrotermitis TaxID=1346286 RepID=A0A1M5F4H8_9BACT|nr:response regulator transcription factor [Dysgonomonas macrotermitis]SHF86288.1 DNA-binding response regulator, OmpR family, contains REC and winged-helix (wHTH) domain [Dysgonomonas macrotermitis]